jgi:glycosyltransferase involved in cell wall biosynthesis
LNNIVIDCRMLRSSGIGTYLRTNLERILGQSNHKYFLMGREREISAWLLKREIASSRISIIRCEAPIYSLREQIEVWKNIPKDCDLFWSPHYVIPVLYRGRMLVTVHDVAHLAMPDMLANRAARLYAKFMFTMVAKKATKIICISNFTKSEFIKYIKVEDRKIEVIYSGCTKFPISDEETKITGPFILYVGNVKPHKNLSRVLAAHSLIFPSIKWPLVVVGKKEGFITGDTELCRKIKTIPPGQVYLAGQVSDAELATYYQRAGFLVLASLYEGFGLPAVEAMGAGVPVLTSRAASLPEVCGDSALYCDPYSVNDIAEKMALLVNDPGLRAKLREKGKEQVKKFSWDESARKHLEIIDELIQCQC